MLLPYCVGGIPPFYWRREAFRLILLSRKNYNKIKCLILNARALNLRNPLSHFNCSICLDHSFQAWNFSKFHFNCYGSCKFASKILIYPLHVCSWIVIYYRIFCRSQFIISRGCAYFVVFWIMGVDSLHLSQFYMYRLVTM